MNVKSTHGLFENRGLGYAKADLLPFGELQIGDGVVMGHNSFILPPTERIGDGAVIAPGSVIFTNVPPFACMSGYPARIVGYRFDKDAIARLRESQWAKLTPLELSRLLPLLLANKPTSASDSPSKDRLIATT